jgi:hypothetical protein
MAYYIAPGRRQKLAARRRRKAQLKAWEREAVRVVEGRCKGCGFLFERETRSRSLVVEYCSRRCQLGTGVERGRARYDAVRVEASDALRRMGVEIAPPLSAARYVKRSFVISLDKELRTIGIQAPLGTQEWLAAALRETLGYHPVRDRVVR